MRTERNCTIGWTAEIGDEEPDVTVSYDISPGTAEYIPPLNRPELYDPGEGDEIVINSVIRDDTGEELCLDDEQLRKLEDFIRDRHDWTDYEPDYEEWDR